MRTFLLSLSVVCAPFQAIAFDLDSALVVAQNAYCSGSEPNVCRNPSCGSGPAQTTSCLPFSASPGYLGVSCGQADPRQQVDRLFFGTDLGYLGHAVSVVDSSSLSCVYVRDPNPPRPTADLCGTSDYLNNCHYLGNDTCNFSFSLYSACASVEYCGVSPATCGIILNGLDESRVPDLQYLSAIERLGLSNARLIVLLFSSGKIDAEEALRHYESLQFMISVNEVRGLIELGYVLTSQI